MLISPKHLMRAAEGGINIHIMTSLVTAALVPGMMGLASVSAFDGQGHAYQNLISLGLILSFAVLVFAVFAIMPTLVFLIIELIEQASVSYWVAVGISFFGAVALLALSFDLDRPALMLVALLVTQIPALFCRGYTPSDHFRYVASRASRA
jgi:hypothetical protein